MHTVNSAEWLFIEAKAEPTFAGVTYDPALDKSRLETALGRVYALMNDGHWRTLKEIATACGISEAGASARLRDLRKPIFKDMYPNDAVNRRRVAGGLWQYQVLGGSL